MSPSPETTSVEIDPGLRERGTGSRARTSTSFTDGRSGFPRSANWLESRITSLLIQREEARTVKDFSPADWLSVVPWSVPSWKKRNLESDEEIQQKTVQQ